MLTVTGPIPTRTFRVLWALEELGLPYEHRVEMPWSEAVSALNPLRQVPVLQDGDTVLTDSLAIVTFLADREGRLTYPAGTPERARMEARINFVLTEMEAPIWLATRHSFILPEAERDPRIKPLMATDFARAEAKFATLLGEDSFFGGEGFTIADIVATHVAGWALAAKFGHQTSALAEYFARMSARPAWKRARREEG